MLPESFMGPPVVKLILKALEDPLLLCLIVPWWRHSLLLQGAVHALVTSVLLRLPHGNTLRPDTKLDEPDAKP